MKKVKITNRSNGFVGYFIPETNLRRSFGPYESKDVDADELQKVMYQSGGQALLDAYFLIDDKELAEEYSPTLAKEPEYWHNKDNLIEIMLYGSQDEFLDLLDFCPKGTLETIKDLAISLPLKDTDKMQAIQNKTGLNVYNAIKNKEIDNEKPAETAGRRVQRVETTTPPKYRRVEKAE